MAETPLHPQVLALIAVMAAGEQPADLAARRAGYAESSRLFGGEPEPVAEVRDLEVAGVAGPIPVRAYRPAEAMDADDVPVIAYFHGGGWVVGDLDGIDTACRALANGSGAVVVAVDYRLAPEHPFPAAVDDADAVVDWLTAGDGPGVLGTDPQRVVVAGDSAGGNLAAVAALHARDEVGAQLLIYPAVDGAQDRGSWHEHAEDLILPAAAMHSFWAEYMAGADPTQPDASPLYADLAGAPPALVAVAGHDVLRDDGLAYAEALRACGVPVEVVVFEDMSHGFLRWGGRVERTRELIAELSGFVRRTLADPTARSA